jgi:mediator of RNA polymerase II transcription subunit 5
MTYQYDLSVVDLGVPGNSFVSKYMSKGHQAISPDHLSEEQIRHVSNWIKILYNSDSITDEQLSKCPPQEYYLLVPTILSQMLMANSAQVLQQNALNTPIECKSSFVVNSHR